MTKLFSTLLLLLFPLNSIDIFEQILLYRDLITLYKDTQHAKFTHAVILWMFVGFGRVNKFLPKSSRLRSKGVYNELQVNLYIVKQQ